MKKSIRNTIKHIGALLLSLMIIISVLGYSTVAEGLNIYSNVASEVLSQNQDEALNAYYSLSDYLGLDEHTDLWRIFVCLGAIKMLCRWRRTEVDGC